MLSQDELKKQVKYDPETGIFTWEVNKNGIAQIGIVAGGLQTNGYIYIKIDSRLYKAHRLAFLYMTGEIPKYVDHIDMIKSNNKFSNLRPATKSENNRNRIVRKDNKTGFKGVSFHKAANKFIARCTTLSGRIHLGVFDTAELASKAYKAFAKVHHGEFYHE
jgi:hypothetical protein